jgi:hypothetical protein
MDLVKFDIVSNGISSILFAISLWAWISIHVYIWKLAIYGYPNINFPLSLSYMCQLNYCCINKLLFVCILFRSSPFLQENKCKHPIILFFWDGIQIPGITIEVSNLIGTSHKLHILSNRLIFFSINHIHIQMTCLSSLNLT